MIDPDAPSAENHKCRSWIHMIFSDVKVGHTVVFNNIGTFCRFVYAVHT